MVCYVCSCCFNDLFGFVMRLLVLWSYVRLCFGFCWLRWFGFGHCVVLLDYLNYTC